MRQFLLFFILASVAVTTGCRWAVRVNCESKCSGYIEISNQKAGGTSGHPIALRVDSQLVSFLTQQGRFLVKAQHEAALLGAKQFDFVKSGNQYVPYNRQAVDNWLQQFAGEADTVVIEFSDLAYDSSNGGEDVTFAATLNSDSMASSTTYIPRRIPDDGYCEGSICYEPK